MTRPPTPPTAALEQWLSVHQACELIGVSPATLRRWSSAGEVEAFTTPGGHRRFARSTILALLPDTSSQRPNLDLPSQSSKQMSRLYHRKLAHACRGVGWLVGTGEQELEPLRHNGRQITGSLLKFIHALTPAQRRTAIASALAAATEYGHIAARRSAEIGEAVEVFLRFRALLLDKLIEATRYRGLNTSETTDVLVAATQATDQVLAALMKGHESQMAKQASKVETR